MLKKRIYTFFLLILFTVKSTYSQCAMCKAVVENGDVSMAEGVNNGITYLMVFPYLLIGVLFYTIYRYKKQAKI
ncbi:hypothetical protein SAMN04487762_0553 [Polaribacter sp. Hel1_33_78]|jgi:hypothetical protein|uniref:hypothetical protein n=1 Tax=Polaribacter sp. Hel1_33_78 TaxID=1336804 RepID=UPI0008799C32|nr:hypothetical protein [Polaribacter sp. Hel1_33_78]SDT91579.1 hypothetical protein SAMN04487762_0553 [Polaribacter sp. Hel1_33_78]